MRNNDEIKARGSLMTNCTEEATVRLRAICQEKSMNFTSLPLASARESVRGENADKPRV